VVGGPRLGCHGDITAEECASLLFCYVYGTYPTKLLKVIGVVLSSFLSPSVTLQVPVIKGELRKLLNSALTGKALIWFKYAVPK